MNPMKLVRKNKGCMRKYKPDWVLCAAGVIPGAIMLFLFIISSIFPFGERSFLASDMYHQYMPFLREFASKLWKGEGLSYSWNIGIGTNFLALYAYYLASPLNWFSLLVPEAYLVEFMSYLVILKVGLCGLTFGIYLRKHFQTGTFAVVLFACFYALSGYMAAYNFNIMWLDCVILLPLILLGLERLVKEDKCILYCVSLTVCILANFYISIMVCIFLVLYFIMQVICEKRICRPVLNFTLYSLLAGGMAAVLLIPAVCAISGGDYAAMDFPDKLESYFSVLDELARHCLCVTTERGLDHWPNLYCGVVVLMMVPMYARHSRIPAGRRFTMLAMASIMLISFSTNVLDFTWHGFNFPNSFPARQSFIYIWLVLVMCFEIFVHIKEVQEGEIIQSFLIAVVFLLFCEKFVDSEDFSTWTEVWTLFFIVIYAILLYFYKRFQDTQWQYVLCGIACLTVVIECGMNMYSTSIGTVDRAAYLEQIEDYQKLYAQACEETEGFWRIEKFERKTKNDGALAGYPTASTFSSTMNSAVADLYESLGMRHSKVYYGYEGATGLTSALLNVQYMFGNTPNEEHEAGMPKDGMYKLMAQSGDISLYKCNYTLPFGYVVPKEFDIVKSETGEPFKVQNNIAEELGIRGRLFVKVDSSKKEENVTFKADGDGYYYAVLTASGTSRIDMTGELGLQTYKDLKYASIIDLGYLNKNQKLIFTNGEKEDQSPQIKLSFYRMNTEVLEAALEELSKKHMTQVTYDSTHVSGHIVMEEAGKVVLSIPYEKGWTIWVNGEETEPGLLGGCLMTVMLEPGEYDISMEYVPRGKEAGLYLSITSFILFAGISVFRKKKAKNVFS